MLKLTNPASFLSRTQNLTATTQVRWRWVRKPIWMGTAKSKIFRVAPRPKVPPDEYEEMKRIHNNYRTQMKSLKNYLNLKYNLKYQESSDPEQTKRVFEEDFKRCMEINDKWNAEQKLVREKQMKDSLENALRVAEEVMARKEAKRFKNLEEVEEIVRREKEAAKSFIKLEDLDEAIEYAMNNPVDYNYAIDTEGNFYYGRETPPDPKNKSEMKLNK